MHVLSGGIPVELLTMLGSGLLSGFLTIWSQSIKAKQATFHMAVQRYKAESEERAEIRSNTNTAFVFTRRTLAIMAMFAVVVWPKIVAVFWPDIHVTVGYTEFHPGWLFGLLPSSQAIAWKEAHGLVLTPLDTNLMASIVGLYFGGSICKNS